jgi:hypothetical protein
MRLNTINLLDFSAIVGYERLGLTGMFLLRRYNGRSHEHTNVLERVRFREFQFHYATERYQRAGYKAEGYAEPTTRYSDLDGALTCLVQDCGFLPQEGEPTPLL